MKKKKRWQKEDKLTSRKISFHGIRFHKENDINLYNEDEFEILYLSGLEIQSLLIYLFVSR